MATLEALYVQDPFWVWLALAALFVVATLAIGMPRLMWPGGGAVIVAALDLAGLKLGLAADAGAFVVACAAIFGLGVLLAPRETADAARERRAQARPVAVGGPDLAARLVGRIGRTTSEFVNGVGRVWIDGAEWGAEIAAGELELPTGVPVRVVKVIGGIRLQVHALSAG